MFNGSVAPIPNADDVSEWFFGQLRQDFGAKAFAYHNLRFAEVWFAIVPAGATEPVLAAVFNIDGGYWFTCSINRTAATTYSELDPSPILGGADGLIYQHEDGLDAGDGGETAPLPWHLTSSYLEIDKGAESCDVFGLMPDMERQVGIVAALMTALDRTPLPVLESETENFGPADGLIDYRISGRELSLTLSCASLGCDFRMGAPKIEYQAAGERR